jgi:dTDP-4-amino-4,6-dideoxygalactose transaminase
MAVHLFGQPCDMRALGRLAARHGIALVEDAAQAHAATFEGRPAASFGIGAAFSFYPSKLARLAAANAVGDEQQAIGRTRLGRDRLQQHRHEALLVEEAADEEDPHQLGRR